MLNNIFSTDTRFTCTGCSACGVICPHQAISFSINSEGFYTPAVNQDLCVECGLCKKVCYKFLSDSSFSSQPYQKESTFAVLNNYIEQISSVSTVGVATVIAKNAFEKNSVTGVIFDAKHNRCIHKIATDFDDINKFTGSKYIQSQCFEAFKACIGIDKKGVVFGTPCQIYGFRKVLSILKKEEQFLLVDLFCAGVPSFNLWLSYLDFLKRRFDIDGIESINFRDKSQGWHKFSVTVTSNNKNEYKQNLYNDLFFKFFLQKKCQNRACYNCAFRQKLVTSDIRLGDFWGEKYRTFDDGVELMTINTTKGLEAWKEIKNFFRYEPVDVSEIKKSQKFDEIPLPEEYNNILDRLAKREPLENI